MSARRMSPLRTWTPEGARDALNPSARPVEDGAPYYQVHGRPGVPVLHGYTSGDVEDAARAAARQAVHRYAVMIPYPDLVDLARTGIYDLLISVPQGGPWPWRRGALIDAGYSAIHREVRASNQMQGRPEVARNHRWLTEDDRRPRFQMFWLDWLHGTYGADPGGSMIDRMAVRQIVDSIADERLRRYALLLAGGATGRQAAEGAGMSPNSSTHLKTELRKLFDREYLGGPRTRVLRGTAQVCRRGHPKPPDAPKGMCPTCYLEVAKRNRRRRRRDRDAHGEGEL